MCALGVGAHKMSDYVNSGLVDSVFMITGLAHETGAVAMQF